jgi:hypothetical protein
MCRQSVAELLGVTLEVHCSHNQCVQQAGGNGYAEVAMCVQCLLYQCVLDHCTAERWDGWLTAARLGQCGIVTQSDCGSWCGCWAAAAQTQMMFGTVQSMLVRSSGMLTVLPA